MNAYCPQQQLKIITLLFDNSISPKGPATVPVSGAYIPIFGVWDTFRYIVTCMMHKRHMSLTCVPVAGNRHTLVCSLKAVHT